MIGDNKPGQSAALPYRLTADGSLELLLVTSRKKGRWVLPRGKVKTGLMPAASAAREAFEEAGVIGRMNTVPIGSYMRRTPDVGHQPMMVQVFAMHVLSEAEVWPEMTARQRRWMSPQRALKLVADEAQRQIIDQFARSN